MSSVSSPRKRLSSPTRMDVLSAILGPEKKSSSVKSLSPRDSLSPLDDNFGLNGINCRRGAELVRESNCTRETQTQGRVHLTFPASEENHAAATTFAKQTACSPRSTLILRPQRPTDLKIVRSNGLTTLSTNVLKQLIWNGHTETSATKTQVPRPKPRKPSTSSTTVAAMGNKPSSIHGDEPEADRESLSSVVRKPVRISRKSSYNLFKRVDSKSPLPRPLTSTSIAAQRNSPNDAESPIDPFMDPAHIARDSVIMPAIHSASTVTMTDELAGQPLSASTTVKEARDQSGSPFGAATDEDDNSDFGAPPPVPQHRSSALSPTIPAPSPLPEDSPHKYGLKDRMDTPELVQEPPEDLNVVKNARRRSTGPEIFNEAKSLVSASSFLNGLSTSRRRAESRSRTTDTWATTLTGSTSRPASRPGSRPVSARAFSAMNTSTDNLNGRRRGHQFKSNGFAYSLPLSLTQIKCYRGHSRLHMSKNKTAPVECAVCHMDDDQEHWTCSWCALRMCRYCRKDFSERGVTAPRERIKQAEIGPGGSPCSSTESLGLGPRGRSSRAYN